MASPIVVIDSDYQSSKVVADAVDVVTAGPSPKVVAKTCQIDEMSDGEDIIEETNDDQAVLPLAVNQMAGSGVSRHAANNNSITDNTLALLASIERMMSLAQKGFVNGTTINIYQGTTYSGNSTNYVKNGDGGDAKPQVTKEDLKDVVEAIVGAHHNATREVLENKIQEYM